MPLTCPKRKAPTTLKISCGGKNIFPGRKKLKPKQKNIFFQGGGHKKALDCNQNS